MEVKQMGPKVMYFLNLFYKTTGLKPQAILFFRDGVSEGQFDAVRFKIPFDICKINCSLLAAFYYNAMRWYTGYYMLYHTSLFL